MKKLLLIEDDDTSYWLISELLEQIGYSGDMVIRCSYLGEVAMLNTGEIEIILTDLTLPDSVYFDTFDQVRNLFPATPIIVLTCTAEIETAISTIQHGAQDYLVKGEFNKKMLHKAIQYAVERNRVLENIFVEKQNLRATINNTKDIIWSVDRQYKIMSANDAFWDRVYAISGKRKTEFLDSDFEPELYGTWVGYYERAFKDEAYKVIWSESKNGAIAYEEVSFNPIHDKDNNVIGVSCLSRDITEQFTHINMIEKQNEQLRHIAWVQSHEVRGPVATILGLAGLFNTDEPADPINNDILAKIKEAANNLDNVIRKINSYTYTSGE